MNWRGLVLGLIMVGLSGTVSEAQVGLPGDFPGGASPGGASPAQYGQQRQQPHYGNQGRSNQQYAHPNQSSPQYNQADSQGQPAQYNAAIPGWQRVGAPGVFSAMMPGHPRSRDVSDQGTAATHWDSDSSEPMHMFAIEMQHCGQVSGSNMDNLLFSLMNARAKAVGAQPTHKRRIDNQRSPGCMFDMITGDSEWNYMIRVVNDKVITMSVCSMPGQGNDQYAQQFFKSFSI
ncbi:MAG: hypothetical protein Q4F00_11975 [bacterium]|nr:hypothetical protein [bacterium]